MQMRETITSLGKDITDVHKKEEAAQGTHYKDIHPLLLPNGGNVHRKKKKQIEQKVDLYRIGR